MRNLKTPLEHSLTLFMYKFYIPYITLIIFLFSFSLNSFANAKNWRAQDIESNTVKVWTKPIADSEFMAFKGSVMVQASVERILEVITNQESYPEWYHNNKLTKQIKKLSSNQTINYSVIKAPWPVTYRDSVTLSTQKRLADGSIEITLKSKPNAYPLQKDLIRIRAISGYWKLTKIAPQITKVTLQISAEPGGRIPSWLANSIVIDMPLYTLTNLKNRVEDSEL